MGGARDSVEPGRSGVLFPRQDVASLIDAVRAADAETWDRSDFAASAPRFGEPSFAAAVREHAERVTS